MTSTGPGWRGVARRLGAHNLAKQGRCHGRIVENFNAAACQGAVSWPCCCQRRVSGGPSAGLEDPRYYGGRMIAALQNPLAWLALALAVWVVVRLVRWTASGGRLPLRSRRGTASAMGAAGLAVQVIYQPSAKQLIEAQLEAELQREDEDEGDPPVSGSH